MDGPNATAPRSSRPSPPAVPATASTFLEHQRSIGNDLLTPVPEYRFPGLVPGDRWCVTAANWLRTHLEGCGAPVMLASTHERTLDVVPLKALQEHAIDVPNALGNL